MTMKFVISPLNYFIYYFVNQTDHLFTVRAASNLYSGIFLLISCEMIRYYYDSVQCNGPLHIHHFIFP